MESGSIIYTDDHRGYLGLSDKGFEHESVKHSVGEYVKAMAHTNGIESVWAVIKRGFNGVYHHWSAKHMQAYIDEFTFRLNQGNVRRDTKDRMVSLFANMCDKTITYERLTTD